MLIDVLYLFIGFVLLTYGANFFVDGSSAIARRFHVHEIIIGLTIVAFGTSLSEASVSIASVLHGANSVAIGNILGSNITNILLVLGLTATISALTIQKNTIKYEIPFVCFITALLTAVGACFGVISRLGAGLLFGLLFVFLYYLLTKGKAEIIPETEIEPMSRLKIALFLILGLSGVIYGSNLIVDSSVNIARIMNVSERIIGLTIIAFGTSLPELVTCVVAVLKKSSDLAVGNIIGSNIINILFVLGVTGLIKPIPFEPAFVKDGIVATLAVVLLWLVILPKRKLSRASGIIFLILYVIYVIYLF